MRIAWIDADVSGTSTIAPLIASGHVQAFPCPDFKSAEGVLWALYRKQIAADMVVVDTLDRIAHVARQDLVIDPAQAKSLPIWENRARLKATRDDYYNTADLVNRFVRPLIELGIPVWFVCHEAGRDDPMTHAEKFVPNVQRGILSNLFTMADAILRLYPSPFPFQNAEGQAVPAGARLLLLAPTPESAAGVRTPVQAPHYMVLGENDPYSFPRFVAAIGGTPPHVGVLYGAPKIGKTQFLSTAVSLTS